MSDVVPILKRLRWGEIGYANLRYKGFEVRGGSGNLRNALPYWIELPRDSIPGHKPDPFGV